MKTLKMYNFSGTFAHWFAAFDATDLLDIVKDGIMDRWRECQADYPNEGPDNTTPGVWSISQSLITKKAVQIAEECGLKVEIEIKSAGDAI